LGCAQNCKIISDIKLAGKAKNVAKMHGILSSPNPQPTSISIEVEIK
jgi:hypothetical protein